MTTIDPIHPGEVLLEEIRPRAQTRAVPPAR